MKFGNLEISNFGRPYIIAELGSNHNGRMDLARQLIDEAKKSGAHCVKFQSWTKETIFSKKVYEDNYFLNDDYRERKDHTLETIVDEYSVSENELLELKKYCDQVKIDFASTPFSKQETDFLVDRLNASFIKIASMDLNNLPFLDYLARKNRPIVLSTGLSTLSEIDQAIDVIEKTGNRQICILHCVSVYPPKDEDVNLNNLEMLRQCYPEYPIGFSDHSIGIAIPLAAVAKGACLIEKHFTLDKNMPGWDHKVSATPEEMHEIVQGSEKIHKALGSFRRTLSEDEIKKIPAFRRSIVAAKPIPMGKQISANDLDLKRPGTGLEPKQMEWVIGRIAKRSIAFDEIIQPTDF